MRQAILGDLHLGRVLYGLDLTPHIKRVMARFFRYCVRHRVEMAVQLGDVFDRPTPSEAHRKLFVQWCNEFERAKIYLWVLTGNHDVMGRRGAVSALESIRCMRWEYVRIVDRPLMTQGGHLFLPFPSPSLYESDQDWLEEMLETADRITWPTTIYCHLNLEGARLGAQEWAYRGQDFTLPPGVYRDKGVDLVLAGHVHKPQRVGKDNVYVVGAAERLRFDEADEDRMFAYRQVRDPAREGEDDKLTFVKVPGLQLRTLELDAAGSSHGGDPPSTEELVCSFSHYELQDAVVKIVPFIDETSFVNWREVEAELYAMGASFVVLGPPVRTRAAARGKRQKVSGLTPEHQVKAFLHARVRDKTERKALWRAFQELKEREHASQS